MNDEMATRLAQELLDAEDEDARARVVVRWLPDFARCQVTTAARVKAQGVKIDALAGKVDALGDKMDAYHAPTPPPTSFTPEGDKETDPRLARLRLILGFIQRNWPAAALLAILYRVFDLEDLLKTILPFLN